MGFGLQHRMLWVRFPPGSLRLASIKVMHQSLKLGNSDRYRGESLMKGIDMDKEKIKRLEEAGWIVGDIKQLFDLTDEDIAFIEKRLEE